MEIRWSLSITLLCIILTTTLYGTKSIVPLHKQSEEPDYTPIILQTVGNMIGSIVAIAQEDDNPTVIANSVATLLGGLVTIAQLGNRNPNKVQAIIRQCCLDNEERLRIIKRSPATT